MNELHGDKLREISISSTKGESEYVAYICHEIRAVLSGIIGYTELLRSMSLGDIANEYIEYLWDGEQILLETMNSALDHSALELDKVQLKKELVSPDALLSEVIRIGRPLAYRKGIELQLHLDSDLPRFVMTDAVRLRQVLINLLNNAINYTDYGRVSLHASYTADSQDYGRICLSVADTGPGLPIEEIPRLMQAFQRNSSQQQGTGLGLFIASKLIDLLGGIIHADSACIEDSLTGKNHGTCFSCTIPLQVLTMEPHDLEKRKNIEGIQQSYISMPGSVLIADDDRVTRNVHRKMLQHLFPTSEFHEATNGIDAISQWHLHHPGIILLDLKMPGMDGIEAAKTIRRIERTAIEQEHYRPCLLIALTGSDSPLIHEECKTAGINQILFKPVNMTQLKEILVQYAE